MVLAAADEVSDGIRGGHDFDRGIAAGAVSVPGTNCCAMTSR